MNPADQLEKAADALFIYGRCRHSLLEDDGRMCVMGAIQYAADPDLLQITGTSSTIAARYPDTVKALADEVGGESHVDFGRVTFWNDTPDTTDAEVIDTLRMVAKDLRNKANQ